VPGARRTDCIFAMSQPEEVDINEILFRPTRQDL
jgi:NADP-dependent 3-hydroxy acid dehydrogenase YdfG